MGTAKPNLKPIMLSGGLGATLAFRPAMRAAAETPRNPPHPAIVAQQGFKIAAPFGRGQDTSVISLEGKPGLRLIQTSKVIGRGNFGVVTIANAFDAHGRHLGQFALKSVKLDEEGEDGVKLSQIEREFEIAQRAADPAVRPLELFVIDDHAFQLSPLKKGTLEGALSALSASCALSQKQLRALVRYVGAQISAQIFRIHQRGALHRDVKLENVLVSEDGELYLSDFGIAEDIEAASDPSKKNLLLGNTLLTPPEAQHYDETIDTWALGAGIILDIFDRALTDGRAGILAAQRTGTMGRFAVVAALLDREGSNHALAKLLRKIERLDPQMHEVLVGLLSVDPEARTKPEEAMTRLAELAGAEQAVVSKIIAQALSPVERPLAA